MSRKMIRTKPKQPTSKKETNAVFKHFYADCGSCKYKGIESIGGFKCMHKKTDKRVNFHRLNCKYYESRNEGKAT